MDNTQLPTGGGGDSIRTLDKTGTGLPKTEVVALDLGGAGGRSESIASFPLPVMLDGPIDEDGIQQFSLSPSSLDALEMLFRQTMAAIAAPYPQSTLELAAGVTPVNLAVFYGNVNRYKTNLTPGVTDMSVAFANALAAYGFAYAPAGTYVASFAIPTYGHVYGDGENLTLIYPPAGATYVMLIDATSTAKQYVYLHDFSLDNPNSVANCDGLFFKGTDVNTINDEHCIERIRITTVNLASHGFANAIHVTGRQISCLYHLVETNLATTGFNASTDAVNIAFVANRFICCYFQSSVNEGFRSTGAGNNNLSFDATAIQLNNTGATAGVAGLYLQNVQSVDLSNVSIENNGNNVTVNTTTPSSNSMGIKVDGTTLQDLHIGSSYITGSGTSIYLHPTNITGGSLLDSNVSPQSGGFAFSILATSAQATQACFVVGSNNNFTGQFDLPADGSSQYAVAIQQAATSLYITGVVTLDMLYSSKVVYNGAGATTISTINNRIPGTELTFVNVHATGTLTIAGGMMYNTANWVIQPNSAVKMYAVGFPNAGKLVPIGALSLGGQLAMTGNALTNNAAAGAGTLTNAPVAGNPTKWVPVNDNGTIRNIPMW